jgi:hypothetical protein
VTSRIDSCNALLAGSRQVDLRRLQRVLNAAARVVCLTPKREPITPVLRGLHWLKIPERIEFKISVLVFKVLQGVAPLYLRQLVQIKKPNRSLRSSSHGIFLLCPITKLRMTEGAFGVAAARTWNALPVEVRTSSTLQNFKTKLKTFLFTRSYTS